MPAHRKKLQALTTEPHDVQRLVQDMLSNGTTPHVIAKRLNAPVTDVLNVLQSREAARMIERMAMTRARVFLFPRTLRMLGKAVQSDEVPWSARIAAGRVIVAICGYNKTGRPSLRDGYGPEDDGPDESATNVHAEIESLTERVAALQHLLTRTAPIDVTPEEPAASPLDGM